jgi:hypothetical protein
MRALLSCSEGAMKGRQVAGGAHMLSALHLKKPIWARHAARPLQTLMRSASVLPRCEAVFKPFQRARHVIQQQFSFLSIGVVALVLAARR